MGQRLNIEIWRGNTCLANAYYHWSAYTDSAAELVNKILATHKEHNTLPDQFHDQLYAVRLLEATGAGLEDGDREIMAERTGEDFRACTGRNAGLIAVTDKGIQDTRVWEEYRVSIYLDQKRVNFGNITVFRHVWDWREYITECEIELESEDMHSLPKLNYDTTNITFDDFNEFAKALTGEGMYFSPIMQSAIITIE